MSSTYSDKYKIIGMTIDSISSYISPRNLWPVNPPANRTKNKPSQQDSFKHKKSIEKYLNKYRIMAIDTSIAVYIPNHQFGKELIFTNNRSTTQKVYDSSRGIKIEINKIKLEKTDNSIHFDSITYFNPLKHIRKSRRDTYLNIDYRFNFSEITYNKDTTEAIIKCIYRFEDRYPNSGLFLFKKNKDNWIISKARFL
ncbi:hypothetical protein [Algibacter sp. 2305UL17-15]|uniref:hypothetical protein n=1 Tax=Algibacter sp. 2305UL17-15 TaxID=3231268 RepID=UPI003459A4C7